MKTILLFLLLMPTVLNAQDVNFQWAKQMIGTDNMSISMALLPNYNDGRNVLLCIPPAL